MPATGQGFQSVEFPIDLASAPGPCGTPERSGAPMIRFWGGRVERPGDREAAVVKALNRRTVVLVGLMGCGKSSVGRRLAQRLGLSFVDADDEIEAAAGKSINEIFADHGEGYFRDGERKVIARLLNQGPQVLATGGGAFMNAETRAAIRAFGISVWLKAELPVLMRRVSKRNNRPLLKVQDPEKVMRDLMDKRYPVYQEADITVLSREVSHDVMATEVLSALEAHLAAEARPAEPVDGRNE